MSFAELERHDGILSPTKRENELYIDNEFNTQSTQKTEELATEIIWDSQVITFVLAF